jgi:hypothetical protein
MFLANLLDAKIIYNQCELYGSCVVLSKSRYRFAFLLSVFAEMFFEEFIGQLSCLREAIHAPLGFDVDASIFGGFLSELVFSDDFIREIT